MNINGNRIYLRAIELHDKEILLEMMNDETTEKGLGGWSFPISELNQEEWIKSLKPSNNMLRCMIVNKENNQAIGTVILSDIDYKNGSAEVHIKINQHGRGKGFGSEAIKLVANYGFEQLRLHCIYSHVNSYNTPSQKLFVNCGFIKEATLRDRIYKYGEFHNVNVYSLLKGDVIGDR